jgi:cytochrome bd ubiquinol oxidase subunit I
MTFPAITVGLAVFLCIVYGAYLRTGNEVYLQIYRFWKKIFAIGFALGVVAGIVLTFELGLNWGGYAGAVGPVLGVLITMEALTAFFLEAGFIGIMLYGDGRVGRKAMFTATVMVALGALLSTTWIMVANSWMQDPAGFTTVHGRFQVTNWLRVIFNPSFSERFPHMLVSVVVSAAWFLAGIGAFYLLKRRYLPFARKTLSIGLLAVALLIPLQMTLGDRVAEFMLTAQPPKLLAAEGNFSPSSSWNLVVVPDQSHQRDLVRIGIPHAGSVITSKNWSGDATVPGVNVVPKAMQPPVGPVFWGFRIMIFAGWAMFATAFAAVYLRLRGRLFTTRWFHRLVVVMMPAGVIATVAGWVLSECGRQPWLVYGQLLTSASASHLSTAVVAVSLAVFWLLYLGMFAAYVHQVARHVRTGPEDVAPSVVRPPDGSPRPDTSAAYPSEAVAAGPAPAGA